MNNPLKTIYTKVSYKMWFINFLDIDCDIKFIIKTLLHHLSLRRFIKPPLINTLCHHDMNTDYIDDQGIVFTPKNVFSRLPIESKIKQHIDKNDNKIIKIYYVYHVNHTYLCTLILNFNLSDCNPDHIKPDKIDKNMTTFYTY